MIDLVASKPARYTETHVTGLYKGEILSDKMKFEYAVNMISQKESENSARKEVQLGSESVGAKSETALVNQSIWRWFVMVALAILLFEWYIYNRRTYL